MSDGNDFNLAVVATIHQMIGKPFEQTAAMLFVDFDKAFGRDFDTTQRGIDLGGKIHRGIKTSSCVPIKPFVKIFSGFGVQLGFHVDDSPLIPTRLRAASRTAVQSTRVTSPLSISWLRRSTSVCHSADSDVGAFPHKSSIKRKRSSGGSNEAAAKIES